MITPNFFIVGAPKSGTSALEQYLKEHPQVFIPDLKEPHYFGSDLTFHEPRVTEDEYFKAFERENPSRQGEKSVWYLYSQKAAQEIYDFNPEARIIMMLRNPVDLLYSLHSQFIYNRNEDITDFETALNAEENRKLGKQIPPHAHLVEGLYYSEVVSFSEQIKRYWKVFGHEQVHIILYEDFSNHTAAEYREVLQFLGIDTNFQPNFRAVNVNRQYTSLWLHRLIMERPEKLKRWVRILCPFKPIRRFVMERLFHWNIKRAPRSPMDESLRKKLQKKFRPEVERLSEQLERDLSHWYL